MPSRFERKLPELCDIVTPFETRTGALELRVMWPSFVMRLRRDKKPQYWKRGDKDKKCEIQGPCGLGDHCGRPDTGRRGPGTSRCIGVAFGSRAITVLRCCVVCL